MGPLVRVTYNGLTQSVFILDRVKSSSCDYSETIPVDSNASCFTCFSSGSSSPEVAEYFLNQLPGSKLILNYAKDIKLC
jgi:hypothetical protein